MTPRIRIVQLDPATLHALAAGDLDAAQLTSPVPLTPWLAGPEAVGTWGFRSRQAVESPQDLPWVTGVVWDDGEGRSVGKAGYHAAPSPDGMVEVGYGIDPQHRRRGYARAALAALLERARREPDVRVVRASISPGNAASLALVSQYGFVEVGEQWDEEDGLEIVYEVSVGP
ncbi:MAG: GNAT family N-acetyltransferase [Nocardioides sp.]